MKTEPPPCRRRFADNRDEAEYLYHKLLFWLYERADRTRARAFAVRLARVLSNTCPGGEAIFPEECWSLIREAEGDLPGAIRHRENEVRLIKRLHEISRPSPQREQILRLYGYDDLSDLLDLLAVLYHDSGRLERAIETLRESKRLCQEHRLTFDGGALLQEYLAEKSTAAEDSDGSPVERQEQRGERGTQKGVA